MEEVSQRVGQVRVTAEEISVESVAASVETPKAGAVVTFHGVVRNHDGGEGVSWIDYSAHPSAEEILADIVAQIAQIDGVHKVACVHRYGHLEVGETAMVAAVSASHRKSAFLAVSNLVDEVKLRLPVWKKQGFSDGSTAWSGI
ncbi:MAG: molybdenum cofactor biosynthesis protein MoaE [Actinomycetaceae bacterium]|nr:molybdenum cofactor biosynthesis protein MoaE [Actinomycetaceae bacterium]